MLVRLYRPCFFFISQLDSAVFCFLMDFAFSWILCRYRKNENPAEKKKGHKIAGLKFYSRVKIFFSFFLLFDVLDSVQKKSSWAESSWKNPKKKKQGHSENQN